MELNADQKQAFAYLISSCGVKGVCQALQEHATQKAKAATDENLSATWQEFAGGCRQAVEAAEEIENVEKMLGN